MDTDNPEVATVTPKGQITIPSRLREQFGLEQGTTLIMRNRG
jgi:antitoxin PrlF